MSKYKKDIIKGFDETMINIVEVYEKKIKDVRRIKKCKKN
jgi:hypothetical protein